MSEMLSNPATVIYIIPVVAIIGHFWSEVAKNRDLAELKRDMVNRGMSADEITQVINSGTKKAKK